MKQTGWLMLALAAGCALAQQPGVENARLETRQISGGLEATLRGIAAGPSGPAWVG